MKKDYIINAGIRLTRKCNMKCTYCNIQSTQKKELSFEEWKKAIKLIKNLGVKEIVILGGEPTLYSQIVELVDYISNELNLSCNLTTNAFDNFEIASKLLDVGLNSLGVSIDNLNFKQSISPLKTKKGLELIDYLFNNHSNPNITNYTVLSKNNVYSIVDIIEYMNARGINTYILPFHWGNEGSYEHRKNNERFAFISDKDIIDYKNAINKIIDMKQNGYKIINSIEFLEKTKKYIKHLNWKCSGLSELRIDSDGSIVCCCDKVGRVNDEFTIFNLEENLDKFFKVRNTDALLCNGCLWPSSIEAEIKREKLR